MEPASPTSTELGRRGLELLRATARDALPLLLAYRLVAAAVLAPVVALTARAMFHLAGRKAVANADLLAFALSPIGLVSIAVLGCAVVTVSIAGHGAAFAVSVAAARGARVRWWAALTLLLRGRRRVLGIAQAIVLRTLVLALPFLVGLGAVFVALLTDYDINYYLTARPPAFWWAAVAATVLLAGCAVTLAASWTRWCLALPLVLLAEHGARDAMRESHAIVVRFGTLRALLLIASGPIVVAAAGALLAALLFWCGDAVLATVDDHLRTTAAVLGVLAVAQLALGTLASLLGSATAVCLATSLLEGVAPEALPTTAVQAERGAPRWPSSRLSRWAAVLGGAAAAATIAVSLVAGITSPDAVVSIAHRAGARLGPENSLAAFRASLDAGADAAEIDVQRSLDGEVVVIHDRDLMKLAGLPWNVAETPAARLCAPVADGGAGLATLAEFAELARGKASLCVELKYYGWDEELAPATLAVLRRAGVLDDCALISLEVRAMEQLRRIAPEVRIGFLSSVAIGRLTRLDVDFLAVADAAATAPLVRDAQAAGMDVYAWTLNDADAISNAIDRGVVGIISDDPPLVARVVAERAALGDVERLLLRFGARRRR